MKLPGLSGTVLSGSNTSPAPVYHVPFRTVAYRASAWKWGLLMTHGGELHLNNVNTRLCRISLDDCGLEAEPVGFVHPLQVFRSDALDRSGFADRCCPKIEELYSRTPTYSAAIPSPPRVSRFHVVFMRGILTENPVAEQPPKADIFMRTLEFLHAIATSVYTFGHWKLRETGMIRTFVLTGVVLALVLVPAAGYGAGDRNGVCRVFNRRRRSSSRHGNRALTPQTGCGRQRSWI